MEENKLTQDMLEKAKLAGSAEELLALAKEKGIELTEGRAREIFNALHSSGALADEELDNIAGGSCWCDKICPRCGSDRTYPMPDDPNGYGCCSCGLPFWVGPES